MCCSATRLTSGHGSSHWATANVSWICIIGFKKVWVQYLEMIRFQNDTPPYICFNSNFSNFALFFVVSHSRPNPKWESHGAMGHGCPRGWIEYHGMAIERCNQIIEIWEDWSLIFHLKIYGGSHYHQPFDKSPGTDSCPYTWNGNVTECRNASSFKIIYLTGLTCPFPSEARTCPNLYSVMSMPPDTASIFLEINFRALHIFWCMTNWQFSSSFCSGGVVVSIFKL